MDLLTTAKHLADRAETEAVKAKIPITICVIDVHGNVVLKHHMGDSPMSSIELSERKAYTAASIGVRTADLAPLVQPGQPLFPLIMTAQGRYTAMGGGVPITIEGKVAGGIGVSGGRTNEQDMAILEAALSGM